MVAIDASALVCYITRFTEENFATLIALIFVYKVIQIETNQSQLNEIQNHCIYLQAIENVLSIGANFPISDANEIYDCVCTSPLNKDDLTWTKYMKSQCLVSQI